MRSHQFSLLPTIKVEFGGALNSGKRKERRPIAVKRPMHVVFKSSMAKGELSFLRRANNEKVKQILAEETQKRGIRTYRLSINSNHFHFLLQGRSRKDIQTFFRVFAGRVSQAVTGAARGRSLRERFWDHLVFTRIVEWGNSFRQVAAYIYRNEQESLGLIKYERKNRQNLKPTS